MGKVSWDPRYKLLEGYSVALESGKFYKDGRIADDLNGLRRAAFLLFLFKKRKTNEGSPDKYMISSQQIEDELGFHAPDAYKLFDELEKNGLSGFVAHNNHRFYYASTNCNIIEIDKEFSYDELNEVLLQNGEQPNWYKKKNSDILIRRLFEAKGEAVTKETLTALMYPNNIIPNTLKDKCNLCSKALRNCNDNGFGKFITDAGNRSLKLILPITSIENKKIIDVVTSLRDGSKKILKEIKNKLRSADESLYPKLLDYNITFPELLDKRFSEGEYEGIVLWAPGGGGKSFSVYKAYSALFEKKYIESGKRKTIIPLFVPLNNIINVSEWCITKYILSRYTHDAVNNDEAHKTYERLLNAEKSNYQYLLFLDGINEVRGGNGDRLFSEIRCLDLALNVTVCLSARVEKPYFRLIDNCTIVTLDKLPQDIVRNYAKAQRIILANEEVEILRTPFFFSRWKELLQTAFSRQRQFTEGSLLHAYINCLVDKATVLSSAQIVYNYAYNQIVDWALVLLADLSMHMHSENELTISEKVVSNSLTEKLSQDVITSLRQNVRDDYDRVLSFVFNTVYRDLGLIDFDEKERYYYFTNEIYRDFFAALNVCNVVNNSTRVIQVFTSCKRKVLDLIYNMLFDQKTFIQNGSFVVDEEVYKKKLHLDCLYDDKWDNENSLSVYGFLSYNMLENLNNADGSKTEFCKSYLFISRFVSSYVLKKWEYDEKYGVIEEELIREHVELLRRTGAYEEAKYICKKTRDIYKKLNTSAGVMDNYINENRIIHADCKVNLFEAFHKAKLSSGYLNDIEKNYKTTVEGLKSISELYTPATNLYAMLLAFPDVISKPYLESVWNEKSMAERRQDACRLLWKRIISNVIAYAKRAIGVTKTTHFYSVDLLIRLLLKGEIIVDYSRVELNKEMTLERLAKYHASEIDFYPKKESDVIPDGGNDVFLKILIAYLKKGPNQSIKVNLFSARRLIQKGAKSEEVKVHLGVSKGEIDADFISSFIDGFWNIEMLNAVLKEKDMLEENRLVSPDSYGYEYIMEELRRISIFSNNYITTEGNIEKETYLIHTKLLDTIV